MLSAERKRQEVITQLSGDKEYSDDDGSVLLCSISAYIFYHNYSFFHCLLTAFSECHEIQFGLISLREVQIKLTQNRHCEVTLG